MRAIKIAALSGLFAATGTVAMAADLSRAFTYSSPTIRGRTENSLGWYLRGDVGYVIQKTPEVDFRFQSFTGDLDREHLGHTAVIGAGIGYRFNPNVRMDLTVDHRFDASFKGVASSSDDGVSITDRARFQSSTFMMNGYLDFRPVGNLTPYVGAGIGVAHNVLSRHVATTFDPATGLEVSDELSGGDKFSLAWALMAGVGYQMSSNFTLDLGYRYVSLGDVKTRAYDTGAGVDVESLGAHEVRLGLRYNFE